MNKLVLQYPLICLLAVAEILVLGCKSNVEESTVSKTGQAPLTSFSQEITSPVREFAVKAGATYVIDIKVKNTGTEPWVGGSGPLTVDAGYRWHDSTGQVLPIEGNRASLSRPSVGPGQSDSLKLEVAAPPNPGQYTLSVSMVQEGVAWFFDRGTKPLVLQVSVS